MCQARQDRPGAEAFGFESTPARSWAFAIRALLGLMCYTFARVGAAAGMRVEDYYQTGKRWWFRLHEKGGQRHEVPAHHNAEAYMDRYLDQAGIRGEKKSPLFRSVDRSRGLTERAMTRTDVLR